MKNDTLLVSRIILLGDRKAFNQLVEFYQSPIRRFFLNLTNGDEELSKDLAQETFIKAWLNISSFRAASQFSTWLYRIAYNSFYDHARSKKNASNFESIENINKEIYTESTNRDINMDFTRALAILKEDERVIMLLYYMEDLTIDKISKIMAYPSGTIKSHLYRGKKKIADYLKDSGYDR
ncbi:RNA polymerase sigma-70 factor, ECF subfamily [Dysgonomonas macrotermitis]|uniref:RNA polymerase sigma-70 factor, ECF subfamily n=2 Tax=Dysgonomonas macrotermitis TaxID=1346286 RepID=A0A1M4ZW73_9BACT|nr:RNA polymerase sigma-70 factor, ECF subfamily [Dysgonomonas macrotermitis]